jgi:hypothetical protein
MPKEAGMKSRFIPSTTERVPQHTDEEINERINLRIEANVNFYATQDRRTLDSRLQELDQEWDIERVLEANAAAISLIGLGLGRFVSRRWYLLPPPLQASFSSMQCGAGACRSACFVDSVSALPRRSITNATLSKLCGAISLASNKKIAHRSKKPFMLFPIHESFERLLLHVTHINA